MQDALEAGSIVAGYRIVRLVARGATGVVYLAEGPDGDEVALKVLMPELVLDARFRDRFLRESQIAAALDQPHVVPTLGVGEDGGVLYLVMRFIEGPDLRTLLRREGPFDPQRAVELVRQVASALDAAHALGLVHRDVKPGNVLVSATAAGEHAFLCDFGLAKHVSSVSSLTGDRALVGTIAYISPEQIEGAAIDARADVYSLGCLLFECLTGRPPFERETEIATVFAHLHEPPPAPTGSRPELPVGFDRVIASALAKDPDARFASCGALAAAAAGAQRGELTRASRRWRVPVAVAAVLATVAAAGAGAVALRDGGGRSEPSRLSIAPRTIGLIDVASRTVVAQLPFASQPWDVAFDAQRAWVLLGDERRVARVDLASRKVLSSTRLPFTPGGVATGGGATWVTENGGPGLVRLDPATGRIAKRFSISVRTGRDATQSGIAFGDGSVWVARGPETVRVDPASGRVLKRIDTPIAATTVVFADGAVWVASPENGRIVKIDPALDAVAATTTLHATITDLAVGNGSVWVSIVPDDVVYRLSPDDASVQATISAGSWPSTLAARDGLWIADVKGDRITRVDASGRRELLLLSGPPYVARYHAGLLWASVGVPEPAAAAGTGKELKILMEDEGQTLGSTDPAVDAGPAFYQLAYATCAYLLNFPDAAGAAGRVLRPEVAAGPPDVSADGRTYRFRIRPGFRFSPPSGQPVTARTFKASIERALSPKLTRGGRPNPVALLSDIVGAPDFAAGRAPQIRGITARGDVLTMHLTRAAGDLPTRLRSSYFCPVPIGTPLVAGGGSAAPIAMAGPYRVASITDGRVVLDRNPNYTGNRPRRIERIVYTDGFTATDAIARVEAGRADYVSGRTVSYDAHGPLAPGGVLDRRFGLGSRAGRAGEARYVPSAEPGIDAMAFNTQRPLFRDVRMRRAAAYALDRRALAAVFGEQPSDRTVPTAVAGPGRNVAYGDEPALVKARRLAGAGPPRRATLYFCGEASNKRIAEIVRANLAKIGIDVHIEQSLGCLKGPETARLAEADIELVSHFDVVPDPAPFVELALGDAYMAPGYWRDAALRRQITAARRLRGAARIAAYARLDDLLVRVAVPLAAYGSAVDPEFFSARVGCKVSQGALNLVDLGALCLRD